MTDAELLQEIERSNRKPSCNACFVDGVRWSQEKFKAENERLRSLLTEESLVDVIDKWHMHWYYREGDDYRDRAFGIDANMKYSLARMLLEALSGKGSDDTRI